MELSRVLNPEVPFVFFSGTIGEEAAIESLRNGAADYVLKDNPARLPSSIRRALAEANEHRVVAKLKRELNITRCKESEGYVARGISRHFQDILTLIRGHVAQFEGSLEADEPTEIAASIQSIISRGIGMTQQILASAGGLRVNFSLVDLHQEVCRLLGNHRLLFSDSIEIVTELESNLPLLNLDILRFEEVFFHIFQTACEAVNPKGKIWISTSYVESSTIRANPISLLDVPYLCLSVIDTGPGMDDEALRSAYRSLLPKYGLGIIEGLMKEPLAMVDILSEKGIGTAVSLYFPVSQAL